MSNRANSTIVMGRRELIKGLAAGTVVAYTAGCSTNPATGRSQFLLVSNAQLAQLSGESWNQLKREQPVSRNPKYTERLREIGVRITSSAARVSPNLSPSGWEYAVFDDDQANAFVLPGQQVGFYKGIMDLADNDDQIAAVMGHEVGHVSGRHAAERYSQTVAAAGATTVANVALAESDIEGKQLIAAALGLGIQFGVLLPYSRRHELEADLLGLDYMHAAGYQPSQAVRFWRKMASKGGQRPPEFLSTHPSPETRIGRIEQHILNNGYS